MDPLNLPEQQEAKEADTCSAEDWTNINDAAHRRRIRNRIAQRNYRKNIKEKLAEFEKQNALLNSMPSLSTSPNNYPFASPTIPILPMTPIATPTSEPDSLTRMTSRNPTPINHHNRDMKQREDLVGRGLHGPRCICGESQIPGPSPLPKKPCQPSRSRDIFLDHSFPHMPIPATPTGGFGTGDSALSAACETTKLIAGIFDRPTPISPDYSFHTSIGANSTRDLHPSAIGLFENHNVSGPTQPHRVGIDNERLYPPVSERGATDASGALGRTTLHIAAIGGDPEIFLLLLSSFPDVNAQDDVSKTAVHYAAERGNIYILNLLLKRGADIEICDHIGRTAIHLAVEEGHEDVVLLLLENGACIEKKDFYGYTPLHRAVHLKREGIVRLLLTQGADVNATIVL